MKETRPIHEYKEYLRQRYGEVLQRIPLDTGFSCPNRRPDGSGGCSFCAEDGGRAPQLLDTRTIEEQIDAGIRFSRARYGKSGLMAYLQAYTPTFITPDQFERIVDKILGYGNFRAITFGTRPDCLPPPIIDLLKKTAESIDVWVELGVQTSHDATLARINRGHDFQCSEHAINRLHGAGLHVVPHLILGLPGENLEMMRTTIEKITTLPISGIKLHNLHVLKHTGMAEEFSRCPFPVYNEQEYMELLLELLPLVPRELPILRLTTDSPPERLLAPCWTMTKGKFLKMLKQQMVRLQICQGMALSAKQEPEKRFTPIITEDGSTTFYSEEFKEHFHTLAGARSEAEQKYIAPAHLHERLANSVRRQAPPLRLLDICFGLGYNSLVACETAIRQNAPLSIIALEIDRRVVSSSALAAPAQAEENLLDWARCLHQLAEHGIWEYGDCRIEILWGDARQTLNRVEPSFDLIWLDGFSTQRNSELWTVDFFRKLKPLLAKDGGLYTYCAAIPVRSGLLEAGFMVGESDPFGRARGGTVACFDPSLLPHPLPKRDRFLLTTTRGIPYRDPELNRSNREILRARQQEILRIKTEQGRQQRPKK